MESDKEVTPEAVDAAAKDFVREAGCPGCEVQRISGRDLIRMWLLGLATGVFLADLL